MSTRETLKSFLNKIGSPEDKISYQVNPSTGDPNDIDSFIERGLSDLGIDPNTGIDLLNFKTKKSLLNDYLSDITENNKFSISGGVTESSSHKRGIPLSLESGANSTFINNNSIYEETLASYSNSKKFINLNEIVDKNSKNFDNHSLLKDIPGSDLDDTGKTLISNNSSNITINSVNTVLQNHNRFSSTNNSTAFSPRGVTENDFEKGEKSGSHLIQNKYGKFDKNDLKFSLNELKNVGLSMLYKASGYDNGIIPGDSIHPDTLENNDNSGEIENESATANLIVNNKFIKRNFKSMRALNAATAPQKNNQPFNPDLELLNQETGNNSSSYGSTYNHSVHFKGKNSKVLSIKASIACKAVIQLAKDFYKTVKQGISLTPDSPNPDYANLVDSKVTTGPFYLGRSRGVLNSNLDLIRRSLITKTKFNYSDCIDAGIEVFFGNLSGEKLDSLPFVESPGFLLSICMSTIKNYEEKIEKIKQENINAPSKVASSILGLLNTLKDNQLIKFLNVLATMGDRALAASGGNKDINVKDNTRNVDSFNDLPGNRQGKHRKKNGRTLTQVSWNQNETINAYILPLNTVRASAKLSQGNYSPNPVKGMLGSDLYKNTYMSVNNDGAGSRIPNEVVKEIEDRLDAEYVPFYIQDLRTNEIISFHAFLSSLSDTITPNFNSTPGYGRMDPVQIYSDTKRSVSVSFTLMATSKEDFDAMWYKINKLTTLVYPQWSQGTKVSNNDENVFIQPFSQVIGASPLVRLRVGDVIKSNYSRFNLARTFGIGDPNISVKPVGVSSIRSAIEDTDLGKAGAEFFEAAQEFAIKSLTLLFGSPAQYMNINSAKEKINVQGFNFGDAVQETILTLLTNGFVNPLLESAILSRNKSPNTSLFNSNKVKLFGAGNAMDIVASAIDNPNFNALVKDIGDVGAHFQRLQLKANANTGYRTDNQEILYLHSNTKIKIISQQESNDGQIIYTVIVDDFNSDYNETTLFCQFSDLYFTPEYLFRASGIGALFFLAEGFESFADEAVDSYQEQWAQNGATPALADLAKNAYKKNEVLFMDPQNNPFTRAYETTKGRGLAGTLGGLTFDWGNGDVFKWEIDHNSRAPMGCKITFNLAVIHDIPPGLDHSGFNRAPIYNVGSIMKHIAGDPHNDGGAMSEFRYKTGREDKKSGE